MAKRKLNRRQQWRIEKIQAEKRDRANRRNDQQENLVADDLCRLSKVSEGHLIFYC